MSLASNPVGESNTYEVHAEEGRVAAVLSGALISSGSHADPWVGHNGL